MSTARKLCSRAVLACVRCFSYMTPNGAGIAIELVVAAVLVSAERTQAEQTPGPWYALGMPHLPHTLRFAPIARAASNASGTPWAFLLAVLVVVVWAATGPLFHFSENWQLVINTGTTIVTFLMVFLIQNSQNRDTAAMQIKLDELIRAVNGAHNALLDLEELEESEINRIRSTYLKLAAQAREDLRGGTTDTACPETTRDQ